MARHAAPKTPYPRIRVRYGTPEVFFDGLAFGVVWTTDWLVERMQACPSEQYVLIGYSQARCSCTAP